LEFYNGLLGLPVLSRRTITEPYIGELVGYPGVEIRSAFLDMGVPNYTLELLEYRGIPRLAVDPQTANTGTAHICFIVEDLPRLHKRLVQAGTQSMSAVPVAPTHGPNAGRRVVYMADPDGIRVEFIEADRENENSGSPRYSQQKESPETCPERSEM
jgi:catechol 2,3-dioxygenase-like lactoylglutathione lyase family enzyme